MPRMEPWKTPQECPDELFDILPSRMIIVVPPFGYKFRDGVTADDLPTPKDVVKDEDAQRETRMQGIRRGVREVDTEDQSKWTKDGSPTVEALEAVLGFDISAEERDQAWADVNPGAPDADSIRSRLNALKNK